jgi:large subunit ribosomal protein L6
MSRIGKAPIKIPDGVKVNLQAKTIEVEGPKGKLACPAFSEIKSKIEDGVLVFTREGNEKEARSLHGLQRALVQNMVTGVTKEFKKSLEITGVGYRVAMEGKGLKLSVGYSHPVIFNPPDGIVLKAEGQNTIHVSGPDKQRVGQAAAEIRNIRKPEPYKGKGIKYIGELITRKAGKTQSK